jgi:serine/threonine-protein kinase
VTLEVSSGSGDVSVPPVEGLTVAAATRQLRRAHLRVSNPVSRSSTQFPAGQVIGTNPGVARSVPSGSAVTLLVSSGVPQKSVPNVSGDTQSAAITALTKAGFNINQRMQTSTSVSAGNVISQSPGGGTNAPQGSTVTITVATAPSTTTVPTVTGDPVSGAVSALTAAGLNVVQTSQNVTNSDQDGIVIHQSPRGSATAKKGSSVTITIGHFVATSTSTTTTSTSTTTTSTSTTTPTTSTSLSTTPAAP